MDNRIVLAVATAALAALLCGACGEDDDGKQCQQSGQRCGGTEGTCCDGLMCCSGVPVPPGSEYCAKDCPISDRNVKYGFRSLDRDAILDRVARLPITSWTYRNEPPEVRHIGPMAQDFRAAFKVGSSDRHISPVDADGVSLAAIQAMYGQLGRLRQELATLRVEVRRLRARCKQPPLQQP